MLYSVVLYFCVWLPVGVGNNWKGGVCYYLGIESLQGDCVWFSYHCDVWSQSIAMHQRVFKSAKLLRWSLSLQEYDVDIKYTRGTQNVVADYLSRVWKLSVKGFSFVICIFSWLIPLWCVFYWVHIWVVCYFYCVSLMLVTSWCIVILNSICDFVLQWFVSIFISDYLNIFVYHMKPLWSHMIWLQIYCIFVFWSYIMIVWWTICLLDDSFCHECVYTVLEHTRL